jgi:hypothetical protein
MKNQHAVSCEASATSSPASAAALLGALLVAVAASLAMLALAMKPALAEPAKEDYASWPALVNPFESTGGGGILIGEYRPVVFGKFCTTNFTATTPKGEVYYNGVDFDAVPAQGGTLCNNGRWRALDGSANGTTPLRVFIKDGVVRRSP